MFSITGSQEADDIYGLFRDKLTEILGSQFMDVWVQGSAAMGALDDYSDLDFAVLIQDELTAHQVEQLQTMFKEMHEHSYWWQRLEGSFFTVAMLADPTTVGQDIWYLDNGSDTLIRDNHDNELVVRWVLREYGFPLNGREPSYYIAPIDENDLKQEVHQTLTTWGAQILNGEYSLQNVWSQSFIVLMYCRMWQTLATGRVESKRAGMEWALQNLPTRWHDLIRESWQQRKTDNTAWTDSTPELLQQTRDFVVFSIQQARTTDSP